MRTVLLAGTALAMLSVLARAQTPAPRPGTYPKLEFRNGAWSDPGFFPLSVWMQPTRSARKYKEHGINIYMNQWKGPTEKQLADLRAAGMAVMVELNDVAVKYKDDPMIVGWLQTDEPDLVHSNTNGWPELRARKPEEWNATIGQYQAAINPATIQEHYRLLKAIADKPVYIGFSFGLIYPGYAGRSHRKNHPEDYPEYIKGADFVGYDIYPGIHQYKPATGKYWTEAWGVKKLVEMSRGEKVVWPTVEACASRLEHTPRNYKAETWMAIIHGAMGINYWVHQNSSGIGPVPSIEDSVFADSGMAAAFAETNRLITSLAPVLNSPTIEDGTAVTSSVPASEEVAAAGLAPIAVMAKRQGGATYVFAVRMEDSPATGTLAVKGLTGRLSAEVVGEDRKVAVTDGKFSDGFRGLDVHIYRIPAAVR